MYNQKFVVAIKANGQILREFGDIVKLPFGTEFSILLKNLNTVKALASVQIDGTNVTENHKIVIHPNTDFELTRFINNGNLQQGNSFKFIERTDNVAQFRGVKLDDGIVRVEFQFEKISPYNPVTISNPWGNHYRGILSKSTFASNSASDGLLGGPAISNYSANVNTVNTSQISRDSVDNDIGITVPGSISYQQFNIVSNFDVESYKHVIILKLVGIHANNVVTQPITVHTKTKCISCGRNNKANSKFCSNCGTSLILI
jgi:hypothetical protein